MTREERIAHLIAHTERIYGPIRDLQLSREAAAADFAGFAHESLMDGAL